VDRSADINIRQAQGKKEKLKTWYLAGHARPWHAHPYSNSERSIHAALELLVLSIARNQRRPSA